VRGSGMASYMSPDTIDVHGARVSECPDGVKIIKLIIKIQAGRWIILVIYLELDSSCRFHCRYVVEKSKKYTAGLPAPAAKHTSPLLPSKASSRTTKPLTFPFSMAHLIAPL
jgi:hypothetical protein